MSDTAEAVHNISHFEAGIGSIDQLSDTTIGGWVKSKDSDASLVIDVLVNGKMALKAIKAAGFRDDLSRLGIGTGRYAFEAPWSLEPHEARPEVGGVVVELRRSHDDALLMRHKQAFLPPADRSLDATRVETPTVAAMAEKYVPGISGSIDQLDSRTISGWIKALGSNEPLVFDVLINGKLVQKAVKAAGFRDDLHKAGFGTGHHAFDATCNLDFPIVGPSGVSVEVELRRSEDGALLMRRNQIAMPAADTDLTPVVTPVVQAQKEPAETCEQGIIGSIDRVAGGVVSGWVKATDSNDPLIIDVIVNGTVAVEAFKANGFRSDLVAQGHGTGCHSFDAHVGASNLRGNSTDDLAVIELRSSAGKASLLTAVVRPAADDPKEGPAPGYVGNIDQCGSGVISGWIKSEGSDAPLVFNVLVNGKEIAPAVRADMFREDLQAAGYGDGQFGFWLPHHLTSERRAPMSIELRCGQSGALLMLHRDAFGSDAQPSDQETPDTIEILEADTVEPSPINAIPPMDCEIRIEQAKDDKLRGWAVDKLDPGHVFDLELMVDGFVVHTMRNDRSRNDLQRHGKSKGLGGFQLDLPFDVFGPGEHELTLRAPDGTTTSTTIVGKEPDLVLPPANENASSAKIAVVVPVYNAADDLEVCIQRLAAHTPDTVDILFIDDCSPDRRIATILKKAVAQHKNMRCLRNTKNLGFSGTINRGISETGNADVIMLNSDARVTPRWSEGLWAAAYSGHRIGTATAMSDRAGAFSAPNRGNDNPLPPGVDEVTYARAFRRASRGLYPRVPTGNGFCMYVRRACIEEVGLLDQVAFPKGYGEENDFCMRAGRVRWHHVIDDRTYVFHDRSKSFGESKHELMAAGRAIVDERYPEYAIAISVFSKGMEISMARMAGHLAAKALGSGKGQETRILFVIATQTGGTPQTNADLMRALDGNIEGWSLRCDSKRLELCRLDGDSYTVVRQHILSEPVDPLTHRSDEYDRVVKCWLLAHDLDLVHIRHLAWHSLTLPALAKSLGLKVVFSFHDFYMLSPTIKMIDDAGEFLGSTFSAEGRETRESLWPRGSQPDPTGSWLQHWRDRSAKALASCDAFVTTSESARSLILEHLPGLPAERFLVIPHGRDFDEFQHLREPYLRHDEPLRILIPGNINDAKGLKVILDLLAHDRAGRLEFHVLGDIDLRRRGGHPRLKLHGKYRREEFGDRVAGLHVHAGAVFSIWDETYCHTLTEMWAVGLPVIVLDMPNVSERVRRSGAGWVVSHDIIPVLYEEILAKLCDPREQTEKAAAVSTWQAGYGAAYGTRMMASHYLAVYRDVLRYSGNLPGSGTNRRVAVVCPADRSLQHGSASTVTRIWERCRNDMSRDVSYIRMSPESLLPAVQDRMVDAVVLQNNALPRTIARSVLAAMRDARIPYLLDLDEDLLGLSEDEDPDGIYSDYAPILRHMLEEAALVTVPNEALRGELAQHARRIELLPDRLSERLWGRGLRPARLADGLVRAACFVTTMHQGDLDMILTVLEAVAATEAAFRCTLIGCEADGDLLVGRGHWLDFVAIPSELAEDYDRYVPWLVEQAARFDFGLVPNFDSKRNRPKSVVELLEYIGMGLPVLASDDPAHEAVSATAHGITLVANTSEDWEAAIRRQTSEGGRISGNHRSRNEEHRNGIFLRESPRAFDSLVIEICE